MSRKGNVTYEKVVEAIWALRKENINITVRSVSARIGGGDAGKISNFIQSFFEEESRLEVSDIRISEELKDKIKAEIVTNVQLAREKDQRDISNLTKLYAEVQELLVRSEQERGDLISALDAATVEKATSEGAHSTEVSLLRERMEQSEKMSADLHSKAGKASEELRQLTVSVALAGEEVNRLRASLAEAEKSQAKLAEENRQLKSDNFALQKDVNASQTESKVLTVSLERAEKQLDSRQEEIKQLNLKLERTSAECANVRETNARLETQLMVTEKNKDLEKGRKTRPSATTTATTQQLAER
jgi:chromosome segregation ATPase